MAKLCSKAHALHCGEGPKVIWAMLKYMGRHLLSRGHEESMYENFIHVVVVVVVEDFGSWVLPPSLFTGFSTFKLFPP